MAKKDTKSKDTKATARVVDMTNVKEGGGQFNTKHYNPGDYPGKVLRVLDHTSKEGNDNWLVVFGLDGKTGEYPYYCSVEGDGLWKIRNVYIACGINVPKKKMKLDPANQIVNKKLGVTLDDDEYEGKVRSKVMGVLPLSELTDDGAEDATEDDEEVSSKKSKKGKADKAKAGKHGKKGKKSVSDDELEELEIEDL